MPPEDLPRRAPTGLLLGYSYKSLVKVSERLGIDITSAYTESLSSNSINVSVSEMIGTGGDSSTQGADAMLIGLCMIKGLSVARQLKS